METKDLPQNKLYPLIYAADAAAPNVSRNTAMWCSTGDSLDSAKVKGKIVVCLRGGDIARIMKGKSVLEAGGAGMVLANDKDSGNDIVADLHFLPATMITYKDSLPLFAYLNSTKSPVGSISPSKTTFGLKPSPMMALFSSQGPSLPSPQILKPDITAPGVNILAAYSPVVSATGVDGDDRTASYALLSGTSMSCPHVAGVAGLVKSLHPNWSPAAIRSAIITTARTQDNTGKPIQDGAGQKATPFNYGSGHIRPNRAADPGLVYDATFTDYLNFLCALGFKSSNVTRLIRKNFTCPSKAVTLENLNYPSITVADLNKTSTARVKAPFGTTVTVKPDTLKFDKVGDEKSFTVTFDSHKDEIGRGFVFGRLIWSDGRHYVRSSIAVNAVA
uniref:Subtilisin-like protease SBT5.3 n=1 Tax=Ananas comosus var. bracteatus TaxID=296719 RepID=A0A6V7Q8N2_ANACO|nr:unnamed protein product [Ananas comosus var. bracteatus]